MRTSDREPALLKAGGVPDGFAYHEDFISRIEEQELGSPIGWHRDIPQFGVVIGISLGAPCRMRFRRYARGRVKSGRDKALSIELKPRSIYLMSGASRETWQHSIPPVKELRYAIMMRTLRGSARGAGAAGRIQAFIRDSPCAPLNRPRPFGGRVHDLREG